MTEARFHKEVVMAGFGGQGVLLIGKTLAYAGMRANLEVTWMPAYGPEMRGGTCNCSVVLSNRPIGSPIAQSPDHLIALNLPSLDKFEDRVKSGGLIVVNTSLINRLPRRQDITTVPVPANELAIQAGTAKAANMVALGAYIGASKTADLSLVKEVLHEAFSSRPKLVEVNLRALASGYERGLSAGGVNS